MRNIFVSLNIIVFLLLSSTVAWAKEPASPEFTLQKAIDSAIAHSLALQNAQYDIERSKEVRDNVSDEVKFVPTGPGDPIAQKNYDTLIISDLNWRSAKKNYEAQKDMVEYNAMQAYYGIIQAQEKVKQAEAALKNAERKRYIAVISQKVGSASKSDVINAEATVSNAKGGFEAAKKALDNAYQKFNSMVGLWPEDRPILTDKPEFNPLIVENLDQEVERAVIESPKIWLAQQKVDIAKINLDLYNPAYPSGTDNYRAKEIDVIKSEINADDVERELRKLVRNLYYNIRQLEEQYEMKKAAVLIAEEAQRVAKVKYDTGMATLSDLISTESDLVKARQELIDVMCSHELYVYGFKKPWAFAAGASSSSESGVLSSS